MSKIELTKLIERHFEKLKNKTKQAFLKAGIE